MSHVIIVETRPENGFIVYHIEYGSRLLTEKPEYMYFQDMLKSNIRYKTCFFLEQLFDKGWTLLGQSQDKKSIFYTLLLNESKKTKNTKETQTSSAI